MLVISFEEAEELRFLLVLQEVNNNAADKIKSSFICFSFIRVGDAQK
jgi:hypothetical protein